MPCIDRTQALVLLSETLVLLAQASALPSWSLVMGWARE